MKTPPSGHLPEGHSPEGNLPGEDGAHAISGDRGGGPRLFVDAQLAAGAELPCDPAQANYLLNVLRLGAGAVVYLFNGRDGEWRARIATLSGSGRRGRCALKVEAQTRAPQPPPDLHYLFAPLKKARLDYMVQKATELGASVLRPVLTRRTNAQRINLERMRANAIEAAEQCGISWLPEIAAPAPLERVLGEWDGARQLVYCDEAAKQTSPLAALSQITPGAPLAVLIGPEGGFALEERDMLRRLAFVHPISLGSRIMRADTAAVAALALVNATLGDWRGDF